ncbi:septum formation inhibitor Maf [Candidatus Parcubacteria bacterium]|nr:MAG: septum formation inhibitor Maf [Candidatus Parcubacteria bacterium]
MKTVILASASPWRKELLKRAGVHFKVEVSGHKENLRHKLSPQALVKRLALEKVLAVAARHSNAVIIGADTVAVFGGRIIGKPKNSSDARKTLRRLSGKRHVLVTGFVIMDTKTGRIAAKAVNTGVEFRKLSDEEIRRYVQTGEPMTVAGGYAIQGGGASFASRIEGDFYNIVGLPLAAVVEELRKFGVKIG